MDSLFLSELETETIDYILGLPQDKKIQYFKVLIEKFYPDTTEADDSYTTLINTYLSSFYLEKLYRGNKFFSSMYTPIYTRTGIIREVVADLYYTPEHLIVH